MHRYRNIDIDMCRQIHGDIATQTGKETAHPTVQQLKPFYSNLLSPMYVTSCPCCPRPHRAHTLSISCDVLDTSRKQSPPQGLVSFPL